MIFNNMEYLKLVFSVLQYVKYIKYLTGVFWDWSVVEITFVTVLISYSFHTFLFQMLD
jgi:hypothetical protein